MILAFTILDNYESPTRHSTTRVQRSAEAKASALRLLHAGTLEYEWPDGTKTTIRVMRVDSRESARIRRNSKGFRSYGWMVDSALQHGRPINLFKEGKK